MPFSTSAATVDDLMRTVMKRLCDRGDRVTASRGPTRELLAATLELTNPRARLGRSETRGKLFSQLGELCWYLGKSNLLTSISYYVRAYENEAEPDGTVHGAYGPRLFSFDGVDQVEFVITQLKSRSSSRKAVIQLFDHADSGRGFKDVPCTCSMQFLVRADALHLIVHMRSNDAYLGLPHDIFCFTMLQELVAKSIGCPLGTYIHMVGSLHLYEADVDDARRFLKEGWQSISPMPSMPVGDPWEAVQQLLSVEQALRNNTEEPLNLTLPVKPYWADLGRLLMIFSLFKKSREAEVEGVLAQMNTRVYDLFVREKLAIRCP